MNTTNQHRELGVLLGFGFVLGFGFACGPADQDLQADDPDALAKARGESRWVYASEDGLLRYRKDGDGNRIPDFSHAGYGGGGVEIPKVPTRVVVAAKKGNQDDTDRIQDAIDEVSSLPLDSDGFRGAVLLERGRYQIADRLRIRASGVVLRGEGESPEGTVLVATGRSRRSLVVVSGGDVKLAEVEGTRTRILDDYVGVGSTSFEVEDTSSFSIGDEVIVFRPSTEEWIDFIGMDRCDGERGTRYDRSDQNGDTCLQRLADEMAGPWRPGHRDIALERKIVSIDGSRLTIDIPIVQALEKRFGGGFVYKYHATNRISRVGVENVRGESEYRGDEDEDHAWTFITMTGVENAWVRDIKAYYFAYSAVLINGNSRFCTVQDSDFRYPISRIEGGRRYPFNLDDAQMVLVQRCSARNGRHDYVLGSLTAGPNVFLDSTSEQAHSDIGPHHRWSTGVLFDNIVTDGEINVQNRGNMGTGHGWAGANTVVWNSRAARMIIEDPPGARNWAIGNRASRQGNGAFDSHGTPAWPPSLYLQQLEERLGPAAVKSIRK